MTRAKGKITSWNDEKGYGFISAFAGGSRTFVHIKAFTNPNRRPLVGDVVTYSVSADPRGRPCAEEVSIAGIRKCTRLPRSHSSLPEAIAAGFILFVGGAVLTSALPLAILMVYLAISTVTFAAYALDKSAARKGAWRTSESSLHLLSLAGGWPGALIAQNRLRHKSKKQPFRTVFWATVALNCSALIWLLTPEGEKAWQTIVSAAA